MKSLTWLALGRDIACVHDRLVIPLAALKASFGPSHRKSAVAGSAPQGTSSSLHSEASKLLEVVSFDCVGLSETQQETTLAKYASGQC